MHTAPSLKNASKSVAQSAFLPLKFEASASVFSGLVSKMVLKFAQVNGGGLLSIPKVVEKQNMARKMIRNRLIAIFMFAKEILKKIKK